MCSRNQRTISGRCGRQESPSQQGCCCCCCCRTVCTPTCGCGCGCGEDIAPTATISMADYEPFILVPTTVFDQGDVGCPCGRDF